MAKPRHEKLSFFVGRYLKGLGKNKGKPYKESAFRTWIKEEKNGFPESIISDGYVFNVADMDKWMRENKAAVIAEAKNDTA